LCALFPAQAHAEVLYSAGNDGSTLYTIDSNTGATSAVGSFGIASTYALAFNTNNTLYGLVNGYSNGTLATINTTTGTATVVGSGTGISDLMALVFSPTTGTAYAASWATNSLYTINTTTGAATLVGSLGFSGIMDLAFDASGDLYGISSGLYKINTATGAGTQVLASAGNGCLMALTIYSGDFYTTDYCSGASPLYKLNTTTGGLTAVGNGAISSSMALTYRGVAGAVPEPATWAMMLLGFGGIGFAMRRKRHEERLPQVACLAGAALPNVN
jgi:DNA-binding beta-propeller fold protein YncE